MGAMSGWICRRCQAHFTASRGGGFFFDELHCEACGASTTVGHKELGDIHLRYIKGLGMPYTMARAEMDRRIQEEYPGEPLDEAGYHAAAEATLDPCPCGGRFRYDAGPRCPACRSTQEAWGEDPTVGMVCYD